MSIYQEKFPGKAQELLRYFYSIRLTAAKKGDSGSASYYEQFRLNKERHPKVVWA
jgi:hypothetical protein